MTQVATPGTSDQPKDKPADKRPDIPVVKTQGNRTMLFMVIAVIACGGWAAFEYRRSAHFAESLATANVFNNQLQHQVDELQQRLTTTTTRLNELAQKNFPVSLIYRPAASGNGLTTIFKNNAPEQVSISVVMHNPVNNHSREASLVIAGNSIQSIGEAEGWAFAPGQHIQMTNAQFGSVDFVVPEK